MYQTQQVIISDGNPGLLIKRAPPARTAIQNTITGPRASEYGKTTFNLGRAKDQVHDISKQNKINCDSGMPENKHGGRQIKYACNNSPTSW